MSIQDDLLVLEIIEQSEKLLKELAKYVDVKIDSGKSVKLGELHVAGTSHIPYIHTLEPHLNIGDRLDFKREPTNPYDSNAIIVLTEDGTKIGYIPKRENTPFAEQLDQGRKLWGVISGKKIYGNWVKINMEIYLSE